MSKPFEWRDFNKKYNDVSSALPTFAKDGNLQNTIKFKYASKAQRGVKYDTSVNTTNEKSTEADFSAKVNFEELKGVELGVKAKSKPATEFTVKLDDKVVPLAGSSFTLKVAAAAAADQTVGGSFGYGNKFVSLNLGFTYPVSHRLFDFLDKPVKEGDSEVNPLAAQKPKVDLDFVARPLEGRDIYVGGNVSLTLPKGTDSLEYNSKFAASLNNENINGGAFVSHKKDSKGHETQVGINAFSEDASDLQGGAQVTYTLGKSESAYRGFAFETVASFKKDDNSTLFSKVQVIPDTVVSLGLEHSLNRGMKLSFGYAFLLAKSSDVARTKSSAYNFGVEFNN